MAEFIDEETALERRIEATPSMFDAAFTRSDVLADLLAEALTKLADPVETMREHGGQAQLATRLEQLRQKLAAATTSWRSCGLDIRCVRWTPYRVSDRLLLDVQPVIPLPEAAELTVRLRRREQAAKAATSSSKDYTRYVITTRGGVSAPLPKRRAISAMVVGLHAAGVSAEVSERWSRTPSCSPSMASSRTMSWNWRSSRSTRRRSTT